ncbi:hypothetical protein JHK87_055304 [Glycine soja]|nr:hypothetical protein JHK87_055304 [Glycine soja]
MAMPGEPFVRIVIINVDPSKDIMESILDVVHLGRAYLTILNTFGTVTMVILHNSLHVVATLTLHEPFTLLCLNGSYLLNNNFNLNFRAIIPPPLSFGIHLSTSRGQAIGGAIGSQVIVDGNVKITLWTFWHPNIYKYILEGNKVSSSSPARAVVQQLKRIVVVAIRYHNHGIGSDKFCQD